MSAEKLQVILFIFVSIVSLFLISQTSTAASTCWDYNVTYQKGGTDPAVNVTDLNYIINYVNTYRTGITFAVALYNPIPNPNFDPTYDFDGNNVINVTDLNALILFVNNHKTGSVFVVNCSTCGC